MLTAVTAETTQQFRVHENKQKVLNAYKGVSFSLQTEGTPAAAATSMSGERLC